jgi:Icc-related predicted phosphoesterase
MKLLCVSDLHDQFDLFEPEKMPLADACLVAGDLTNWGLQGTERYNEVGRAGDWLRAMGERYGQLLWIPGNHDIGVTARTFEAIPNVICALNQTILVGPFSLQGISLTQCFENPMLKEVWDYMTDSRKVDTAAFDFPPVDIVLSHGPPRGILDGPGRWGSPGLLKYIERHQPRLVVCGHIHEEGGKQVTIGKTLLVNTACQSVLIELAEDG